MEKPPNNIEEGPESFDEFEGLIEYYEEAEAKERLKPKVEHGPHIEELEVQMAPYLMEGTLAVLNEIKTEEEALKIDERRDALDALSFIAQKLRFLDWRTNITDEELEELQKKYKIISKAVGIINGGKVDHNR